MVDSLSYFPFQPVLHDWYNKGQSVCCPVCGMMHIKVPFLLPIKSSPCSGGSRFLLSLSDWYFTNCAMSYNHKIKCVEGKKEMFYSWLFMIAREETCCRHIGYSFRLAGRVLLYESSHRQDNTYHCLCHTTGWNEK